MSKERYTRGKAGNMGANTKIYSAPKAMDWQELAEKAEAELKEIRSVKLLAALLITDVKRRHFTRIEDAEKALEEAEAYHVEYIQQQIGGSTVEESIRFAADKAPNYAEWLKNMEGNHEYAIWNRQRHPEIPR